MFADLKEGRVKTSFYSYRSRKTWQYLKIFPKEKKKKNHYHRTNDVDNHPQLATSHLLPQEKDHSSPSAANPLQGRASVKASSMKAEIAWAFEIPI